jgi:hypothetical protein
VITFFKFINLLSRIWKQRPLAANAVSQPIGASRRPRLARSAFANVRRDVTNKFTTRLALPMLEKIAVGSGDMVPGLRPQREVERQDFSRVLAVQESRPVCQDDAATLQVRRPEISLRHRVTDLMA